MDEKGQNLAPQLSHHGILVPGFQDVFGVQEGTRAGANLVGNLWRTSSTVCQNSVTKGGIKRIVKDVM